MPYNEINIDKDIDLTALNKLAGSDLAFKEEIFALILSHTRNDVSELESNLKEENWAGIKFTAHRMRSSLSPLGLIETIEKFKHIERQIQQKNFLDIEEKVEELIIICNLIVGYLNDNN